MGDECADADAVGRVVDVAERVDAVDGDDRLGQGRLALASSDDEVAAAGNRTGACGDSGERLVEGGGNREVHDWSPPDIDSHTRSAVIGR